MGMSEENLKELSEKLSRISMEYLQDDKLTTKSHLAEKIASELSYNELIFMTTDKVLDSIETSLNKMIKDQKDVMSTLLKIMGKNDKE